jgi:response regulator RpfG family c-di-GMP phosphodiesterase
MLHDIGKVGISDVILKKKGSLTESEFKIMQYHTIFGAQLFANSDSDWEKMAKEITLNHHEKWDGSGYPGKIDNIMDENIVIGKGKKGAEIPLSARIVALADVFDALISKRIYKDPWEEDKVLYYIKEQTGKHFDPEIVGIFFEIYDVIRAIRSKWE